MLYQMIKALDKFVKEDHTPEELNQLPDCQKYVIALLPEYKNKLVPMGLDESALEETVKTILTDEKKFEEVLNAMLDWALELGCYKGNRQDAEPHKSYHPLIMASYIGKVEYLKLSADNKYAWKDASDIIYYTAQHGTGYSLDLEDRYAMLVECTKHGYNFLTDEFPNNGCPNNYGETRGNDKELEVLNELVNIGIKDLLSTSATSAIEVDKSKYHFITEAIDHLNSFIPHSHIENNITVEAMGAMSDVPHETVT